MKTDREKILNGLLDFVADLSPFAGNHGDWMKVHAAIQELEPIKPFKYDYMVYPIRYTCGNCRKAVYREYNYCPNCGKAVKWDAAD